ncbi:uncharacterized protein RJT21DRAFT_53123 [Scheffersomyces amazonensis]|uniref:uncharacterized protein n=1 Tax=Scheffersomyces amazonensis TaxID=1078765 RepID=UPI00315CE38B
MIPISSLLNSPLLNATPETDPYEVIIVAPLEDLEPEPELVPKPDPEPEPEPKPEVQPESDPFFKNHEILLEVDNKNGSIPEGGLFPMEIEYQGEEEVPYIPEPKQPQPEFLYVVPQASQKQSYNSSIHSSPVTSTSLEDLFPELLLGESSKSITSEFLAPDKPPATPSELLRIQLSKFQAFPQRNIAEVEEERGRSRSQSLSNSFSFFESGNRIYQRPDPGAITSVEMPDMAPKLNCVYREHEPDGFHDFLVMKLITEEPLPTVGRRFYTRPDFFEKAPKSRFFIFQMNHRFRMNAYEPEYIQIELNQLGIPISDNSKALCPFCEDLQFFIIKDSSYSTHLACHHGIGYGGLPFPNPIYKGKYLTSTLRSKTGVICPLCYDLIDLSHNIRSGIYSTYFEHFKVNHEKDWFLKCFLVPDVKNLD